jgi:penicillin G amidase
MNKTKTIIIGSILTFFVLAIAVTIFLYTLLTKSLPETKGTVRLKGLNSEVKVFRNEYSIPQIVANNEHDLMFAYGYSVAQDRLWQMDLQRRIGEGKLSEIFGEETLEIDALFRTIGFDRIAEDLEKNLSKESRDILQAYADGINAYVQENRKKLQIEFDLLGYEPEKWEIKHSLIILRLFSWQMSLGWWTDLVNTDIIKKLGEVRAADLLPNSAQPLASQYSSPDLTDNMERINNMMQNLLGIFTIAGSNAWVISGEKSLTGHPIIANDPHLVLSAPSVWYQISLHSPNYDATGLTIPGIPGIIIGNNGKTAWSVTNSMADDCDFFSEVTDSLGLNKYFYENSWNNLTVVNEKIRIKNAEPLDFPVYYTKNGPIISNFTELKGSYEFRKQNLRVKEWTAPKGKQVSMRWCGFEMSDEILGLSLLNKSKSIIEIEEAIKYIKSPSLNFVFCDNQNIGYKLGGLIPVRNHVFGHTILPGTTSEFSWKGFVNYSELPSITNPEDKFLVSANNKIQSSFYISSLWENPARYDRITELMKSKNKFSLEDIQNFQMDDISCNAKTLVPIFINVLEKQNTKDFYFNQALTYLKNWDCSMDKSSIPASIFNVLCSKILRNILLDKLGENLFEKYCFIAIQPTNFLTKVLCENKNSWFDNLNTPGKIETREEVIYSCFIETLDFLKSNYGSETKNWRWGELHKLTLKHPFGRKKPLDRIFNIGPFETDGTNTTINCGYFDFNNPYNQVFGPSARFICDMSNPQYSYSAIASGISGQPLSNHYRDQINLMVEGKYVIMNNSVEKIQKSNFNELLLLPSK